jgi:hypothetical protein
VRANRSESESHFRSCDFAFPVRVMHVTHAHLTLIAGSRRKKSMSSAHACGRRERSTPTDAP